MGVLGLLVEGAFASSPAATNSNTVAQTNTAVVKPMAPSTVQPSAPIGGGSIPDLIGRSQWPGYYNGNNSVALGGQFGPAPVGGIFYAGAIGGAMNGQNLPGGRWTNLIIAGAVSPGFPPGGMLNGPPAGGQFGSNILGGLHSPSNSFYAGPKGGIIIGGAQTAGAAPGGIIVAGGTPPGGAMAGGASPGGIIVGGARPNTNAPGGQLR